MKTDLLPTATKVGITGVVITPWSLKTKRIHVTVSLDEESSHVEDIKSHFPPVDYISRHSGVRHQTEDSEVLSFEVSEISRYAM